MRILSRYLLRLHIGPFLFSLAALTMLLLLDQVSRRFEKLVGKGLHWSVISEVFVYSIPFILAQTLPMAVLIAVLYTFNRLAADNEITAIRAGGIPMHRILVPLVVAGGLLTGGMVWFNDTVLPESNHRLAVLLTSIGQKMPTFELREQTVNEVLPGGLYLQVGRIDRQRSELEDVVIYDQRRGDRSRTIYADSARMAYNEGRTDLYLTLHGGVIQEQEVEEPEEFHRMRFSRLLMRVQDVTNELKRNELGGWRSDREMTIEQMEEEVATARERAASVRRDSRGFAVALVRHYLEGRGEPLESAATRAPARPRRTARAAASGAAAGAEVDRRDGQDAGAGDRRESGRDAGAGGRREGAGGRREGAGDAGAGDEALVSETAARAAAQDHRPRDAAARFRSHGRQLADAQGRANQFSVEIQKKYAIPAACIVFVLIGAPVAMRYPLGGVALVVAVSFAVFCAYYVALVGGEELADRLILSPFWAMWTPNVLFGTAGLVLVWRARRAGR